MHNIVSYKGMPDWQANRQAVLDLVWWCGYKRTRILMREIKSGCSWQKFNMICAFSGASGFPVIKAYERWAKRQLTDKDWENNDEKA